MLQHPYSAMSGGQWMRGNLHTHTTASDGRRPHQTVIDDYASRGYGFLEISDHDIYTSGADYKAYESRGMVLIPGNEVTANGPHVLQVGGAGIVKPSAERQVAIDDIAASGGSAIFNHPNWQSNFSHCPQQLLEDSEGYLGIEIYNGVVRRLQGSPYATDRWDRLLSEGRNIWGFANDDSHIAEDVARGWNVAYVKKPNLDGVLDALRTGRFYASTGVLIRAIRVEGMRIGLETENAERIVALKDWGERVDTVDGSDIFIDVPEQASYVRFECWGRGESFAWTQPIFIR